MSRSNSSNCINPNKCDIVGNTPGLRWKTHLLKHGWVILNKDSYPLNTPVDEWLNQIRDWIRTFGASSYGEGLDSSPSDVESWLLWQQKDIPGSNKKNGYVASNAGHTSFMWDARLFIKPVFDNMWEVDKPDTDYDLVTSFEGFTYCVSQPSEDRQCLSFSHPEAIDDTICIRSFICLSDTSRSKSGGIVLVDKSHKDYNEYVNHSDRPGRALVSLWKKEPERFIRPAMKPGDVLLFNSMTVTETFAPTSHTLPFIGLWVTMLPSDPISTEDIERRIQMFMTKKQSNAWCYGDQMALSVDTNTYPFKSHSVDAYGNIVVNGRTISKTNYTDAHAKLVVGTSLSSIHNQYELIKYSNKIKRGQEPKQGQRNRKVTQRRS
jgi:hypothetical protein